MSTATRQAAATFGELIERINQLFDLEEVDEFTRQRMKRDAEALAAVKPEQGHTVLGALAALDWNGEAAQEHYAAAIRARNIPEVHQAFAITLSRMGYVRQALDEALSAYMMAPEDGRFLRQAFEIAIIAGAINKAVDLAKQWSKSFPDKELEGAEGINAAFEAAEEGMPTDEQINELNELAYCLCRERKIRPNGMNLTTVAPEGSEEFRDIVSTIYVMASTDCAVELSIELFEKITRHPKLEQGPWKHFLVCFERSPIYAG